jgi:hypothetical protein
VKDWAAFRFEQAPHHRTGVLKQLETGTEALTAGDRCLSFRSIEKSEKLSGQGGERDAVILRHALELNRSSKLNAVSSIHQSQCKGDIGLDVSARAERMNGDSHCAVTSWPLLPMRPYGSVAVFLNNHLSL